jgi:hypothetical protein
MQNSGDGRRRNASAEVTHFPAFGGDEAVQKILNARRQAFTP